MPSTAALAAPANGAVSPRDAPPHTLARTGSPTSEVERFPRLRSAVPHSAASGCSGATASAHDDASIATAVSSSTTYTGQAVTAERAAGRSGDSNLAIGGGENGSSGLATPPSHRLCAQQQSPVTPGSVRMLSGAEPGLVALGLGAGAWCLRSQPGSSSPKNAFCISSSCHQWWLLRFSS